MKEEITMAAKAVVVIGAIAGALTFFAKEADMQKLTVQVSQSSIDQELFYTNQMIWAIEERCGNNPPANPKCSPRDQTRWKMFIDRVHELERKKASILKKGG